MSRPDVGGTSGGLQGTYSARGTTSAQNSQYLNGVNVGDPAAIGAAGFYYDFDAFDDIQVSTGAHDITVPTGGVFLNMVTKSGGNTWAGRATFAWLGDADAERATSTTNAAEVRLPAEHQRGRLRLGRQLQRRRPARRRTSCACSDRSATGACTSTCRRRSRQTSSTRPNITSGLVNLTYQLNQNNRITGFYSHQATASRTAS